MLDEETKVKKGHIMLMKHPQTALWSGVMMMGTTTISDDENMTAYTDGVNKIYGRKFLRDFCETQSKINGLILHENLHIGLRHPVHAIDLFKKNAKRANKAADYVVNDFIMEIHKKYPDLVQLPEGGCYDYKYHNMNIREVYKLLEEEEDEGGGGGNSNSGGGEYQFDEHGFEDSMTSEQAKEMDARVDRAIREGALLAGRLGVDLPRQITELLEPSIDWRAELSEFVSAACKGKDEYTWRRFNKRQLANDMYLPSVENETIGEVIVAIDTSGSIGQEQINMFASELVSICEAVQPDAVRILWWDTKVHGQQLFTDDYQNIGAMLKPKGGGGTRVSCVSEYLNKNKHKAECVLVFTDGYLESSVTWDISAPTLWLVTENKNWVPPVGKVVHVKE